MNQKKDIQLMESIGSLVDFVGEMTGTKATPEELAFALSKYFVRKEILEFIKLHRQAQDRDQE